MLRRFWLLVELLLLFAAVPVAMDIVMHQQKIPLFLALLPVLTLVLAILLADPSFRLRREATRFFGWRTALTILLVFAVGGAAVAYWMKVNQPAWFMDLPTHRPAVWQKIMLLYPIGSVLAQELIYRTFYFHRYGPLFGGYVWPAIGLNALLFGLGHIVVGNTFAMIATCFTGLLFAVRYHTAGSFWAVWIEHSLWGALAFTVGLNRYFFSGVPNF